MDVEQIFEARRSYRGRPVRVAVTDPAALPQARRALARLLAMLRRVDLELARVHRAAGRPTPVGPLLRDLVGVALGAADVSGGDVDPTVAAARLRDGAGPGPLPVCSSSLGPVGVLGNWRSVALRGDLLTVPATLPLDLGGTSRAHLAQRTAERITARTGSGSLVAVGSRTAVAGPSPDEGWPVCVAGQVVAVTAGALVTADRRRPDGGGVRDPRSGAAPDSPWRAVTVAAPEAALAATLAIAALVRGADGPAWLARQGVRSWPVPRQEAQPAAS